MNTDLISHAQLKIVYESMLDGVVIHNDKGEIILFNQPALSILGLSEDQLYGKTSFDPSWRTVNEDLTTTVPELHPAMIACTQGIIVKNRIMGIYQPNGDLKWINITAVPTFKENSKDLNQVVVTFQDITNQKKYTQDVIRLKDELANREIELTTLLDSLNALVGHWDKNLINLQSNRLYAEYFGKSPFEIKGKHIVEVLGPKIFELNKPYIDKVLAGETQIFERDIPTENGIKNTIASYIPEISNGEVKGFFVIVTDITPLKNLEKEQRSAEAKLLSTVRLSWLGEMASGIAHEINNPLAIILLSFSVLRKKIHHKDLSHEDFLSSLEELEDSLLRISRIVKGMALFSRDGSTDKVEEIKVSEVLLNVENLCAEKFKTNFINFEIKKFDDFTFTAKKVQIIQSLVNLIYNSYDAVQEQKDKWIRLEIIKKDEKIMFILSDSGPRISSSVVDKMMLPFFTTKPPGKGTGLGLSVTKSIALEHGGDLKYIDINPNTTFSYEIKR